MFHSFFIALFAPKLLRWNILFLRTLAAACRCLYSRCSLLKLILHQIRRFFTCFWFNCCAYSLKCKAIKLFYCLGNDLFWNHLLHRLCTVLTSDSNKTASEKIHTTATRLKVIFFLPLLVALHNEQSHLWDLEFFTSLLFFCKYICSIETIWSNTKIFFFVKKINKQLAVFFNCLWTYRQIF